MEKFDWRFDPPNRCQRCHMSTIEIYNYFNSPMGYAQITESFMQSRNPPVGLLNRQEFYTFRCKTCGTAFPVKWVCGYPVPDFHPQSMKEFIAMFKDCK